MVRPASFEDISQMVALGKQFYGEADLDKFVPYNSVSMGYMLRAMLENDNCRVLVAELKGRVVGAIGGTLSPYSYNFDYLVMLENFWFFDVENRRTREALQLVIDLKAWAKEKGAILDVFGAFTHLQFERLARLYDRLGMEQREALFFGRL